MTKKEQTNKRYWLLPLKITEYDTASLVHGLCESGGSIYNKNTIQNTLYDFLLVLTIIDLSIKHRLV
jgi:hypothetical protein